MAKLPFIQFFPADWIGDTRPLSLAAKGAWIDILCILHASVTRGERSMTAVAWARTIGATADQAVACIDELASTGVADVEKDGHGNVTVRNRRMLRDDITREQGRLRKQKQREKEQEEVLGRGGGEMESEVSQGASRECHAGVTDRRQKLEAIIQNTPHSPPRGAEGEKCPETGDNAPPEAAAGGELWPNAGVSPPDGTLDAGHPTPGAEIARDCTPQAPPNHGQAARATKPRQRNALFDALAAATEGPAEKLTRPALRKVGTAIADIRAASPDVTPEEIARRAANYPRVMPQGTTLTASALAKHWARCESSRGVHAPSAPKQPEIPEPEGDWRGALVGTNYGPGGNFDHTGRSWASLDANAKRFANAAMIEIEKARKKES